MGPGVRGDHRGRVRRVFQRIVGPVDAPLFDVPDFRADRDHRLHEAVQLGLRLRFGRFDHQRAGHRERHGRRVQPVVHQPLGHVLGGDPARVLQRAQIDDALVRDEAAAAGVQDRVVRGQAPGHVVGAQQRHGRGPCQSPGSHHRDVHPDDRQDPGRAVGRRTDRTDGRWNADPARQERRQVRFDGDRTDARATPAVRNAKGLVQVQMGHVAAEAARRRQSDQRIQVGAIDVHLPAVAVYQVADRADRLLEHAVRGRVGDHQRGQPLRVAGGLCLEVGQINVAAGVTGDHDDLQSGQVGRCRVGAVRAFRNQAHVALHLATRAMPGPDREQSGQLALRAGVRLQAQRVVAGALGEPALQRIGQLPVTAHLILGRVRMRVGELRPADRNHLRGRVQLHRAGAERDHRPVQRQIAIGQPAQVAQHRRLRVVAVEHRVRQDRRAPRQVGRDRIRRGGIQRIDSPRVPGQRKQRPQGLDIGPLHRFVQRDAHRIGPQVAQVHAVRASGSVDRVRIDPADGDRVEEVRAHPQAGRTQSGRQHDRPAVDPTRDPAQALGPVVDRIKRGDLRQQRLRGADVRGRLLAADMLLARLQREPQRRRPLAVDRDAHHPPGQRPLQGIATRHESRVRPAEGERQTETLGRSDHQIGAPFARWRQQHQRHRIGRDRDQGVARVRAVGEARQFRHIRPRQFSRRGRILQQVPERVDLQRGRILAHLQFDADRLRPRLQHRDRLRVAAERNEERGRRVAADAPAHHHRLGRRGGFVQQRGVGHRQAGQVAHQRLEIQHPFQPSLRDLGLVGRIRGVPGRVLQHVAGDHLRQPGRVVAHADVVAKDAVAGGQLAQARQRLRFPHRRIECERGLQPDRVRDDRIDQRGQARLTQADEHRVDFGLGRADVPSDEVLVVLELRLTSRRGASDVVHVTCAAQRCSRTARHRAGGNWRLPRAVASGTTRRRTHRR